MTKAGPDLRARAPDLTTRVRLENGLVVLVRRVPGCDVAAVVTRVNAGYFDEADHEVGISHVLEHMYFKGTTRRGPGDIGREIRAAGGIINAGTIYDRTSYYAVVPAEAVAKALDIQADAFRNARIDAGELARELIVIIEEVKRKRDTPPAVAQEALFAAMFDRHRMRRWRIGEESALARIDAGAVRAFWQAHYRPDNTILAIVGGVDPDAVRAEVERLFGDLPARQGSRDRGPAEPERTGFRFREQPGDISRTYVQWGWRTEPALHEAVPVLDLLAVLLGQGRASRLYRGVRERGLAQEIGARHYAPTELGVFGVSAVVDPAEAGASLDAMADVVAGVRASAVSAPELDRAKRMIEAALIRSMETAEAQANRLADWQALGDWRLFDAYVTRLAAVTPADVRAAAVRYLDPDRATVMVYAPASAPRLAWSPPRPGPVPAIAVPRPLPDSGPAAGAARSVRVEEDVRFYAQGAVDVVVLPRASAPLVSLALAWRGGANEEPAERPGTTELIARTSLKGTGERSAADIALQVEALGGVIAASAADDVFDWSLSVPSRHFGDGLEILADVALHPAFPDAELETERKAVLGGLLQVRDDMRGYPFRLMLEAAFPGHRYGAPIEAWERTAREVGAGDLARWHARTTAGRAVTAFIVGDVDADEAAARVFARVRPSAAAAPPEPPPFAWPGGPRSRIVERDTSQTAIALAFPGPPRRHPDTWALRLLAAAVGGLGGRLFEELRSRRGLAYTVSAGPIEWAGGGAFACYIATSPEREDEARDGLLEEMARLAAERLPDGDVDRARRFLIGARRIRRQTSMARLGELAGAILLGTGIEEIREYEQRILALESEDLRAVAERWLDAGSVAQGVVRGTGSAPK